jgi:hypothetical protein
MLKWNPRLRIALVVAVLVALALVLGWADIPTFLEW